MKTINIVSDRIGTYVMTIRRGKVRRYRRMTPASLTRVRRLIRVHLKRG